jgi:hypothetical protein
MVQSRDAPNIRPDNPGFLMIRSDTGFDGRISGRIPDTSNSRISGQSFERYRNNVLDFHFNIAIRFWQQKLPFVEVWERKHS